MLPAESSDQTLVAQPGSSVSPWGLPEAIAAPVIALVVYEILGTVLYVVAPRLYHDHPLEFEVTAYQFLAAGVAFGALVLILMRFRGGLQLLGYRYPGWRTLLGAAISVLPIYVAVGIVVAIFVHFFPSYHVRGNARDLLQTGKEPAGILLKVFVLLQAGIEAPFVEETLFRGIIFQGLRHFFARFLPAGAAVAAGAVISGVLFGLAHPEPHTWPILMFLGIVLAYVFYLGKSIYASIIVHGTINTVAVIAVFSGGS